MDVPAEILASALGLKLSDANEAETRRKIVDRILYEILGWSHDDIQYEERVSEDGTITFADYVIRTANTAIVVEAKRIGKTFETVHAKRREKLTPSFLSGALGETVTQARDYARSLGIDFAAVTNGESWVIFPAQRHDQVKFQDCSAIVFDTLTSVLRENFQEFYDLLSRQAVINGSLESALIGRLEDQIQGRRLRNLFPNPLQKQRRNPMFGLIEGAVATAFSDSISDADPTLLEKCYVATPERMRFDSQIKMHISRRQELFRIEAQRPMKSTEANALRDTIKSSISNVRPIAILVLGTVGAGKTTFLQYTRKIKASDLFEKTADRPYPHWIYIDFREITSQEAIGPFIYRRLRDYLQEDDFFNDYDRAIAPAYKRDIESLKKGVLSLIKRDETELNRSIVEIIKKDYDDVEPYVTRLLQRASRVCPIFLIIDNVDQLDDEEIQSRIFSDAIAIGNRLGINLVLSLRQSTYVRHRTSPTFNAFDFDALVIDPPKISSVLSKRFLLAKHLLNGVSGEFLAENGALFKVENAASIIELVQSSVLGTEIGTAIEVLATEDVRLALRMTREFLESGYSNPGRALQVFRTTGNYVMPKHEAFRSILLGTKATYSEEFSAIGNPFDARLSRTKAQLLRLFIMTALVQQASEADFRHAEGPDIAELLQKIGFGARVTETVLEDLCRFRFIHTEGHTTPSLACSFYPSRLAGHTVRNLITDFTFMENVLMDTFIPIDKYWDELRTVTTEIDVERNILKRIELRIKRVKCFYECMAELYAPVLEESQRRGLPSEWCFPLFDEARHTLEKNLARVRQSANKNYSSTNTSQGEDELTSSE